jgi:HD-GYP domain-containing protein (c-di-GMP phosphodiesterase class II)
MEEDPEAIVALMLDVAASHPAAARHAATVAHFSRALARAAGLSEHEQGVVHTAGLLHDIGALAVLEAGQHEPEASAQLLRRVPALAEVADVVAAQQRGERPLLTRVLAIAEVYDTLGAAGAHLDHAGAITELRRLAGSELDARLVRIFIERVLPDEIPAPRPSVEGELRAAAGVVRRYD